MAGVALGVGVLAATAVLALGGSAVGTAVIRGAHASGVADAAALAAADTASGAVTGVPCERAAALAGASGAIVVTCDVDGLVATGRGRVGAGLLTAEARARAGPASASPWRHASRPRR